MRLYFPSTVRDLVVSARAAKPGRNMSSLVIMADDDASLLLVLFQRRGCGGCSRPRRQFEAGVLLLYPTFCIAFKYSHISKCFSCCRRDWKHCCPVVACVCTLLCFCSSNTQHFGVTDIKVSCLICIASKFIQLQNQLGLVSKCVICCPNLLGSSGVNFVSILVCIKQITLLCYSS